jgi:phage repressor protein C with HTH and peptisase S24 domain
MNIYQYRRERLLELIEAQYAGSRVKFCDHTGLSESRLAQLLSSTYRSGAAFTEKTARKVEEMAGLAPMYFDQGAAPGAQQLDDVPKSAYLAVEVHHVGNPDVVLIPQVDIAVRAGITGFSIDGSAGDDLETYPLERRWLERNGFSQSRLIAMKVTGESMFPLYKEGDVIVINTADVKPIDGKEYVVNFGGDVVLKRLTRDAGSWWLTSENTEQRYHRRIVRGTETQIIGRVVKHDRTNL